MGELPGCGVKCRKWHPSRAVLLQAGRQAGGMQANTGRARSHPPPWPSHSAGTGHQSRCSAMDGQRQIEGNQGATSRLMPAFTILAGKAGDACRSRQERAQVARRPGACRRHQRSHNRCNDEKECGGDAAGAFDPIPINLDFICKAERAALGAAQQGRCVGRGGSRGVVPAEPLGSSPGRRRCACVIEARHAMQIDRRY